MKDGLRLITLLLAMVFTISNGLDAQAIFSGFDFNSLPLTEATFGPDATSIDADVISDGNSAYIIANCGALKGIDLSIPNTWNIFNVPSMGMDFSFRKTESRSDFFVRGGTAFYQTGGTIYINYRTTDGASGFIDYGPYNTGFALPADGLFHLYSFVYLQGSGIARVTVDGGTIWTNDGPDNRPLYWTGAPSTIIIGTVMDGNCPGAGTLNYAYFFNPDVVLPIEYLSFEATEEKGNANLAWETTFEGNNLQFLIERSGNGVDFETIGELTALEKETFHYTDVQPGHGTWFYRIRQVDLSGEFALSKIEEVAFSADDYLDIQVWPNPTHGLVNLRMPSGISSAEILIMDSNGRTVGMQSASQQGLVLDLSTFARGLYYVQCQSGSAHYSRKVVLE